MTLVAHYLSLALAAVFALPAARYAAFSLACVDAARASNVSACDVAARAAWPTLRALRDLGVHLVALDASRIVLAVEAIGGDRG